MVKNMQKKDSCDDSSCKPEIHYPCLWQYRIIGKCRDDIMKTVADIVSAKEYMLTDSSKSSGGKYTSMRLELVVESEQERLSFYHQLVAHQAIKIVL